MSRCRWVEVFYAWRPNLPDEADNHLIELAVTDACVKFLGASAGSVDILFFDVAPGNWATAGKIWSAGSKSAPKKTPTTKKTPAPRKTG